jgi:hypothetical protein
VVISPYINPCNWYIINTAPTKHLDANSGRNNVGLRRTKWQLYLQKILPIVGRHQSTAANTNPNRASFDTKNIDPIFPGCYNEQKRIESKTEVLAFLDKLRYALQDDQTKMTFQHERRVDQSRNFINTNRYTIQTLFPDEDVVKVLKRELSTLTLEEYMETVKDIKFANRSEMRVFGRQYAGKDVYIKIRVELLDLSADGRHTVLVMSFHFAEEKFTKDDFPYGDPRCVE